MQLEMTKIKDTQQNVKECAIIFQYLIYEFTECPGYLSLFCESMKMCVSNKSLLLLLGEDFSAKNGRKVCLVTFVS